MEGFKDRLLITLRFIYDFNFIYLLFLLVTTIIYLVLDLGHDGKYELLQIWFQIISLYRENETSYFIQVIIIPIYNFLDWLLSGKYQVLPKLITKLIKGRISLMLKTSITFLVLLYLTSLFVGIYVTNQEEKATEEERIAREIQQKKNNEILIQRAEESRLREQERIEKQRLSLETIPYQGLSCKLGIVNETRFKPIEIVLVLRKLRANQLNSLNEIDLRTSKKVIDGVIYNFVRFKSGWIESSSSEISLKLGERNSLREIDVGDYLNSGDKLIFSRSSLKLVLDRGFNPDLTYQCELVNHEGLYSFVEKHNASITSQNKF